MQGTIVKVLVEVGATVEPGQAILVLERPLQLSRKAFEFRAHPREPLGAVIAVRRNLADRLDQAGVECRSGLARSALV